MTMESLTVLPEESESRLDHVLGRLLPEMGLRGRRRLCELGLVTVNDRQAPASRKMRTGDVVLVLSEKDSAKDGSAATDEKSQAESSRPENARLFPEELPRLVRKYGHLAVLFKPASIHTESLAGKPGTSLQALLPELLGGQTGVRLLNRLDFSTSGLTVAALDEEGESLYRQAQENGQTTKRYLALLEGALYRDMLATQKLILKNRSRVLVELAPHPDIRRHTNVQPLAVMDAAPLCGMLKQYGWEGHPPTSVTLAGCTILKGARHQIRAHCAALGFPLLGDRRYGAAFHPAEEAEETFFLHHGRLLLPGLDVSTLPPWLALLDKNAARAAERWLKD